MRAENMRELHERLNELADAFHARQITEGALRVWLDVLKEFTLDETKAALCDIPKKLTRFPAPADVYKLCNERRSERIENEAKRHATETTARVTQLPVRTPNARRFLAEIKTIASTPRPAKRQWITRILERQEAGDKTLSGYALNLAMQADKASHVAA